MAHFQIDFFSEALQMSTCMQVILPQRTTRHGYPAPTPHGFPVLYLLHGMGDNENTWCRRTAIERYVEGTPLAVVCPTTHLGFYTNGVHGLPYETFFGEELPRVCHEFFPQLSTRREDTFIGGNSMGGYGAVKLALKSPGRYAKAFSFSGALDLVMQSAHIEMTSYWTDLFGSKEALEGSSNDLLALAKRTAAGDTPLPSFYFWCGKDDPLLPLTDSTVEAFSACGYPVTAKESDGGHTWDCWDKQIEQVIPWLLEDWHK